MDAARVSFCPALVLTISMLVAACGVAELAGDMPGAISTNPWMIFFLINLVCPWFRLS